MPPPSDEKEEEVVYIKRTDVVDGIWHCYTVGHQAVHYYRHGGLDLCTDASARFWDVVKRGTKRVKAEVDAGSGPEPHWKKWGSPEGDEIPEPLFKPLPIALSSAQVFGEEAARRADWIEVEKE